MDIESIENQQYNFQSRTFNPQKHYDNSKGSLYQFAENQGLNAYEFDIVKRIVRSRKKGNFKEDLEKTKDLIDLYLLECEQINRMVWSLIWQKEQYYLLL